ncbi:hypothetical protein RJ639_036203 [Escallonia herrerae]|uniref:C2 domain-containing protein n=1 Tax=Escallonia herrerae TaxID=1293975 RepID=A0AA88WQI4_9ASTE|nr:hypothetical protein RJ639_036203 [Escallonia herrerae]
MSSRRALEIITDAAWCKKTKVAGLKIIIKEEHHQMNKRRQWQSEKHYCGRAKAQGGIRVESKTDIDKLFRDSRFCFQFVKSLWLLLLMESGQGIAVSKPPSAVEPPSPKPLAVAMNPCDSPMDCHRGDSGEDSVEKSGGSIGVLEVYIHQARDIHNICIYQKQDVYAKFFLTSDPETTLSTKIINGGGKNPIFDENFRLDVQTFDSSLKCEIWMLSRVKNYLQDQLLGFAFIPLSNVVVENRKLARDFSLSSSDVFHSPAGFVRLTLTYTGALPEVLEIPAPHSSFAAVDPEVPSSVTGELNKIEFVDPNILNENEMMVSEYFEISQSSKSVHSSRNGNHQSSDSSDNDIENVDTELGDAVSKIDNAVSKIDKSPRSVESPKALVPTSSQTVCDTLGSSNSVNQDSTSSTKEKKEDDGEAERGTSAMPNSTTAQPVINVDVVPEPKVVQQEIVDMYMKSMQQFTDALAKMKLPMSTHSEQESSGNTASDEKVQASKGNEPSPKLAVETKGSGLPIMSFFSKARPSILQASKGEME